MNADAAGSLAGRRIVVTRVAEQAEEIVSRLESAGAQVVLLPMVRFAEPRDANSVDAAITALDQFDWVIFTSANAVRFFVWRWRHRGAKPWPPHLLCAAVGATTREALEDEGLHAAFVPTVATARSLFAELSGKLAGKRVLLPRSDIASGEFVAALQSAGAKATAVVAYETAMPKSLDAAVLDAIRRGDADAIVFFSPSAFRNFAIAIGNEELHGLGGRVAFAAVGPTTAAAIREAGVPVAVEAAAATAESFVVALQGYFTPRAATKERV